MQFPVPKVATLSNGIRVVMMESANTAAVMVNVAYAVGSRHEPEQLAGIAHFIEHVVWKGCRRWPDGKELYRALDLVGADSNAMTDVESTQYYVELEASSLALAVEVLSEMLCHPLFAAEHIEVERGVILSEAMGRLDVPEVIVMDMIDESMYPADALGRNIIGTSETINAITRADMLDFMAEHYIADNMIITVSGRFDEVEVLRLLETGFGEVRRTGTSILSRDTAPVRLDGEIEECPSIEMSLDEEIQQSHLMLGFEVADRDDPVMTPTLHLLANLFGGTMSSRLVVKLREDAGLAYQVGAHYIWRRGTGQFLISAGVENENLNQAMEIICEELADLRHNGVTEAELAAAKSNIRGRMALDYESPHDVAASWADELLFSAVPATLVDELAGYEAVTVAQIQATANQYFQIARLHVGVVSPFDDPTALIELSMKIED